MKERLNDWLSLSQVLYPPPPSPPPRTNTSRAWRAPSMMIETHKDKHISDRSDDPYIV